MANASRWFVAALLGLAGCSVPDEMEVASSFIKSVDVQAAAGATIEVSAAESPELAGAKLVIPPGALAADTRISVALQRQPVVEAPDRAAGATAIWSPAGTAFSIGAELSMPFHLQADQALAALFLQVVEEDGTRVNIEGTNLTAASRDAAVASATINGFTRFQHGVRGCPSANHPCPANTTCHNGKCEPDPSTTSPELCSGGVDEDGDGLVDCYDHLDCDQYQACLREADCADQLDNDGDGLTDCADSNDCANATNCACPPNGCCSPTANLELGSLCSDQRDNDCDGAVDCRDPDCFQDPACTSARSCCASYDPNQRLVCVTACDPVGANCYCGPTYCVENGGPCQ